MFSCVDIAPPSNYNPKITKMYGLFAAVNRGCRSEQEGATVRGTRESPQSPGLLNTPHCSTSSFPVFRIAKHYNFIMIKISKSITDVVIYNKKIPSCITNVLFLVLKLKCLYPDGAMKIAACLLKLNKTFLK